MNLIFLVELIKENSYRIKNNFNKNVINNLKINNNNYNKYNKK